MWGVQIFTQHSWWYNLDHMVKVLSVKFSTATLLFFVFPNLFFGSESQSRAPLTGGRELSPTFRRRNALLTLCIRLLHERLVPSLLYHLLLCSFISSFLSPFNTQVFSCIPFYLLFRFLNPKFCISFLEVALKYTLATVQFS